MNMLKNNHPMDAMPDDEQLSPDSGTEFVDRDFVTALARGLKVLRCFGSSGSILGPTEVANISGLPKSTVTRLVYTLTKLDYLTYVSASGKYRLGPAMFALGTVMLERLDVRQIAHPLMQELAIRTGAQVALAVRDRLSMLYIESCRGQSILTLNLDVGSRIPIATTAIGRAYIVALPDNERAALLERVQSTDEFAWRTIASGIDAAIREYEQTGCCSSIGDWTRQVHGIAAPLKLGPGFPQMAVTVAGHADTYTAQRMRDEIRPLLLDMVHKIESRLGRRS